MLWLEGQAGGESLGLGRGRSAAWKRSNKANSAEGTFKMRTVGAGLEGFFEERSQLRVGAKWFLDKYLRWDLGVGEANEQSQFGPGACWDQGLGDRASRD